MVTDTLSSLAKPLCGESFLHPLTLACSQPYFKCLRNSIGFCEVASGATLVRIDRGQVSVWNSHADVSLITHVY